MKYVIKQDFIGEGGSAEFYILNENKNLGFKQFRNKRFALASYKRQKLLSQNDLAPKVIGTVQKLKIDLDADTYQGESNWGYITEIATIPKTSSWKKKKNLRLMQKLVDEIKEKTKLEFWDCHYYNVGYIKRNNKAKLVCIDTGKESFERLSNMWGNINPGPKCKECHKYFCSCKQH